MNAKKNVTQLPVSVDIVNGQIVTTATGKSGGVMSMLAGQFSALSNTQRTMWNLMNNPIQTSTGIVPSHATRFGQNGWSAYYACNVVLYNAGMPLVSTPYEVIKPANLPLLNATITVSGAEQVAKIVLTPQSEDPYPAGPILAVWASQATPQGNGQASPDKWRAPAYFFLSTYTGGIPAAGLNVTAAYNTVFGSVPVSCRIGFKAMAINPGGYHSDPAFTFGLSPIVQMAAGAEGTDEGNLQLG